MKNFVRSQLLESAKIKQKTADTLSVDIARVGEMIAEAYKKGNKLLLCGNGGSAADAQHITAELVGRFKKERKALPALALTTNTSIITAIGNDYGYDQIFARQIEAWGDKGDVLLVISTSGDSENILEAIKKAKSLEIKTVGLTGIDGGKLKEVVEIVLRIPSDDIPRIQETHITIGHIICDIIEQILFSNKKYS